MTCKRIRESKVSDKPIIIVCTLPEEPPRTEKPPRMPKASDKREVPSDFDPERRVPPPDPRELDNKPKLMKMLEQLAEAVEEHAFDNAIGEWESKTDYVCSDVDDVYDDAIIELLANKYTIVDMANDACDIDSLSHGDSWELFMIAKHNACESDEDIAGMSTLGERDLKLELLAEVFLAWYDQRWVAND